MNAIVTLDSQHQRQQVSSSSSNTPYFLFRYRRRGLIEDTVQIVNLDLLNYREIFTRWLFIVRVAQNNEVYYMEAHCYQYCHRYFLKIMTYLKIMN